MLHGPSNPTAHLMALRGLGVSRSISRWHHCYLLAKMLQSGQQQSPSENISLYLPERRDRLHPPGFGSLSMQSSVLQFLGSGLWGCRKAVRSEQSAEQQGEDHQG